MKIWMEQGKNLSKKDKYLIVKENIKNFSICKKVEEELENLKRLYIGYEEKLAKIENRGQRQIDLNFYKIIAK